MARQNAGKIESAMKTNTFSKSKLLVGFIIVSALILAGCSAATPESVPTETPTVTASSETTEDGALIAEGQTVATPTAPANSETDLGEENLLTNNREVIASMVDDFANKKTEFPRNLNPEQYSAFIDEMNNHVGRKSIWVETGDGNVLYYDVKQNKMVSVPGTYEQNKDLIEQNQIELFVKIKTDPETGNVQFVNSEGELVTSPNSANVDWNLVVDASNYKNGPIDFPNAFKSEDSDAWYDKIIGGVSTHEIVQKLKQAFMPGILMDDVVCKIVQEQNGWKQYPCINIMFVKADKDGNPLYGIRTMVGGGPNIFVGEEGGEIDTSTTGVVELRDSDDIKKLEAGAVYYVGAPINQDMVWQEANKSDIDALQGIGPESNKYTNISSENMPDDGNIVIAGAVLIKKK